MRKGVSDIMALAIVVALVISIASMLAYWSREYTEDITGEVSDLGDTASVCMGEFIDISDLFINTSSDTIEFVVENGGTSAAELVSAIAYNSSGDYCELSVSGKTILSGGIVLMNGSACSIYPSCEVFDTLEVTTTCGIHAVKESIGSDECS